MSSHTATWMLKIQVNCCAAGLAVTTGQIILLSPIIVPARLWNDLWFWAASDLLEWNTYDLEYSFSPNSQKRFNSVIPPTFQQTFVSHTSAAERSRDTGAAALKPWEPWKHTRLKLACSGVITVITSSLWKVAIWRWFNWAWGKHPDFYYCVA